MLRFLSLFWKDAAATRAIANRLKLSNDERNRIVWPAEDETPLTAEMTPHDVRVAVYRVGAPVVLDRATLALAESGDPAWADIIAARRRLAETRHARDRRRSASRADTRLAPR